MKSICINVLLQNTANVTTTTIADFRDYIINKIPNAKITWCPNNVFMFPGNKNDENALIASYLALGDDIGYGYGFPAVDYPTLAEFQSQMDESESSIMTRYGRLATVFISWHLPATYCAELVTRGVKIACGTVWSQTGVDRFQGEGSRLFPYFPSTTNSFVPGKTEATTQDILLCNSLSPDTLGCRALSGDSRWTLHPADPDPTSSLSQKHILDQALLQEDYPLFVYPEIDWLYDNSEVLADNFKSFIDYLATKEVQVICMDDYNDYYRANFNNNSQFGMVYTGSGITYGNSESDSNLKQFWYEDKDCTVCLEKNLTTSEITVECCLYYIEGTTESYGYFNFEGTLYKDWSYRNGKSYKFDQFGTYYDREIYRFINNAISYFSL